MTKQDILNAIDNSPLVVEVIDIKSLPQVGILKTYEVNCIIGTAEKGYNSEQLSFYVIREGQNDEAAYWRPNMEGKLSLPPATFKSIVAARAEQAKTANQILSYFIKDVDEESTVAEVKAWVDINGTPTEQSWLAYRTPAGGLQLKKL